MAGGIGITAFVALLPRLLLLRAATRRVRLIWIVRDVSQLEWIAGWMAEEILAVARKRGGLRVTLFVTGPGMVGGVDGGEERDGPVGRPSRRGVEVRRGRPDVGDLVEREAAVQVGAMAVGCCGPGRLGDEVRGAVRREVGRGRAVEYVEEGFGW